MPTRAPRICGCGRTVPSGTACPCQERAARERKARHDTQRPSARKRGYDAEWTKAAKAFLSKPGNDLCACGAPAVLVRHVRSIRTAPHLRLDPKNWRPGCQSCNQIDAAHERRNQEGN